MMLITDLIQQARNRAFTHHKRIVLCGTTDHRRCSADNWNHGILMFIDGQHHDRIRQENENLLYANALTLRYGQLYWKGAGGNNILFKPNTGMARGANGSFYYCAVDAKHSRRLYLSYMGHTRIEKISNCDDI